MTGILSRLAGLSLRSRLFAAVLAWTTLGTAAILLAATRIYSDHVDEHFNAELAVHVEELARLTALKAVNPTVRDSEIEATRRQRDESLAFLDKAALRLEAIRVLVAG